MIHYRKAGLDFYYVVNEGEETIAGEVSFGLAGALEYWDPLTGESRSWPALMGPYSRLAEWAAN